MQPIVEELKGKQSYTYVKKTLHKYTDQL